VMCRVVSARLGVGVSVRVVPELTEHPGAECHTKSWQGTVNAGVRVLVKMLGQGGLELGDLAVELGDDAHCGAGGGPERVGDRGRCGQLLRAQRGLDFMGTGGDIAFAATTFERSLDRRPACAPAPRAAGSLRCQACDAARERRSMQPREHAATSMTPTVLLRHAHISAS
jgi:hypothetical protein